MILNSGVNVYEKNHANCMETEVETLPSVGCLIRSELDISLFLFSPPLTLNVLLQQLSCFAKVTQRTLLMT